jgi:ribosome-binding protein aMBF1 (putative translation factor)
MAKYSTGGSGGGGDGDACELCGESSNRLREAEVAGAQLLVCRSCAPHDDADRSASGGSGGGNQGGGQGRSQHGADGQGGDSGPPTGSRGTSELWDSDTSDWEREGTDYESDPLPYLVTDYGGAVTEARQDAGLQLAELAEELDVPEDDLLAIEQGRAARAGVGGSLVRELEERLDVDLVEET